MHYTRKSSHDSRKPRVTLVEDMDMLYPLVDLNPIRKQKLETKLRPRPAHGTHPVQDRISDQDEVYLNTFKESLSPTIQVAVKIGRGACCLYYFRSHKKGKLPQTAATQVPFRVAYGKQIQPMVLIVLAGNDLVKYLRLDSMI